MRLEDAIETGINVYTIIGRYQLVIQVIEGNDDDYWDRWNHRFNPEKIRVIYDLLLPKYEEFYFANFINGRDEQIETVIRLLNLIVKPGTWSQTGGFIEAQLETIRDRSDSNNK